MLAQPLPPDRVHVNPMATDPMSADLTPADPVVTTDAAIGEATGLRGNGHVGIQSGVDRA